MKVFVSGTYDILHAGHVQFFKEAKELGDYLVVSFCSSKNLKLYKGRTSAIPDDNKKILLEAIRYIDKVYVGNANGGIFDFIEAFILEKPNILVVTEDDKHIEEKIKFCKEYETIFTILPKTPPLATPISTSEIRENIKKEVIH